MQVEKFICKSIKKEEKVEKDYNFYKFHKNYNISILFYIFAAH